MAEWIESWDFKAMTSYNRKLGVRGQVGTSRLEFFSPEIHTHGFSPLNMPSVKCLSGSTSKLFQIQNL